MGFSEDTRSGKSRRNEETSGWNLGKGVFDGCAEYENETSESDFNIECVFISNICVTFRILSSSQRQCDLFMQQSNDVTLAIWNKIPYYSSTLTYFIRQIFVAFSSVFFLFTPPKLLNCFFYLRWKWNIQAITHCHLIVVDIVSRNFPKIYQRSLGFTANLPSDRYFSKLIVNTIVICETHFRFNNLLGAGNNTTFKSLSGTLARQSMLLIYFIWNENNFYIRRLPILLPMLLKFISFNNI